MYNDKKVSAVIVAAGSARRMNGIDKQYTLISDMPVLARSAAAFENDPFVDEIVIAVRAGGEERCRREIAEKYNITKVTAIVHGGAERQDSVKAALAALAPDTAYVLIHDGARPLVTRAVIDAVTEACAAHGAAVPAVPVKDTVKAVTQKDGFTTVTFTPERSTLRAVQTPQGFEKSLLERAYAACGPGTVVTDDASLVETLGEPVYIVDGDEMNIKITTPSDTGRAEQLLKQNTAGAEPVRLPRTGSGFDVHAFAKDRKLILGGVEIPHDRGLLGHSDADVLTHAVMDALLGAAALGDIGKHFPDTDPRYSGISSMLLLGHVAELLRSGGWRIINIDVTVIAQCPKVAPYLSQMKKNLSDVLKISESQINIKGTTTERLGFTGREEGIAAQAAASVIQF